jgi:hypothetical protein
MCTDVLDLRALACRKLWHAAPGRFVDRRIYAKRAEDEKYILIPPEKVEYSRDNPDGRDHLCAPSPGLANSSDTVYCLALGGAA